MEILLSSDHPRKDYLVEKLIKGGDTEIYTKLRDRVQTTVTLNSQR